MEQNLRDLMAAAADKRADPKETNTKESKPAVKYSGSQRASTSHHVSKEEKQDNPDSEELFTPSSQEIFQDSEELFPTQPNIQAASSPENNSEAEDTISSYCQFSEIFSPDSANIETETFPEDDGDSEEENTQLSCLNRTPSCSIPLPKLEPLENHSIMFSPHIRSGDAPRPFPSSYRDKWDFDHVRMPCSNLNKFPIENLSGETHIESRWSVICHSLQRDIGSSQDLEDAIMMYNSQYKDRWNFNSLHTFFNLCLTEDERLHFFETILPPMINMALDLPNICTQPPPLLKKNKDHYLTMTQKQVGCLLLNAFFCTFPRRNHYSRYRRDTVRSEYSSYPDINFNRLFSGVKNRIQPSKAEKLKCLLNYFRRITSQAPTGTVTFHRQFIRNVPKWNESTRGIKTAVVKSSGLIETEGSGMFQVDFANKFVGGGVLGNGCVQEEIRFVICPELLVSRLFVECLGPTEVLIVTGLEQFNRYSGYSDNFQYEGNFNDETPRDTWGRRCTQLVAMDATHFTNTCEQFKTFYVERELNKAFCGFYEDAFPANLSAVATGNWGCGAFNGSPSLKFVIQLMAASQAGRDVVYFTFGNRDLKRELKCIYDFFAEKNLAVGDVWRILLRYCNNVKMFKKQPFPTLHDYLSSIFSDKDTDTYSDKETPEISTSDEFAARKLLEDIGDDSDTEIEENGDTEVNDPG